MIKMKKIFAFALAASLAAGCLNAQKLVILHTNDTHSHIDMDSKGVGGVLQRKAMIDSIKAIEKNVVVIDAGDIVQGSLYFNLFKGELEYKLMDLIGYDMMILGNHEFDNGLDDLAKYYKEVRTPKISSNYDFSATALGSNLLEPYLVKEYDGKRVGFLGLNLKPDGIIADKNFKGLKYTDIIEAANNTATLLRKKLKCDVVVAVSHIGYENSSDTPMTLDGDVAAKTRGIDVIVGGHSHTALGGTADKNSKPVVFKNLDGKSVLVAQTGRYGANLGYISLDLKNPRKAESKLLPVVGVDSTRFDSNIIDFIKPYRAAVDSLNSRIIGVAATDMRNSKKYAESVALTNLTADIAQWYGNLMLDSLQDAGANGLRLHSDLAVMNSGGIRLPMSKGGVSEGELLSMFPFPNKFVVVELTGEQLFELLAQATAQGGQGVSSEVKIAVEKGTLQARSITIGGEPIDPQRTYYVTTIDYLANGGDYLDKFKAGKQVWVDEQDMNVAMKRYVDLQSALGMPLGLNTDSRIFEATDISSSAR